MKALICIHVLSLDNIFLIEFFLKIMFTWDVFGDASSCAPQLIYLHFLVEYLILPLLGIFLGCSSLFIIMTSCNPYPPYPNFFFLMANQPMERIRLS